MYTCDIGTSRETCIWGFLCDGGNERFASSTSSITESPLSSKDSWEKGRVSLRSIKEAWKLAQEECRGIKELGQNLVWHFLKLPCQQLKGLLKLVICMLTSVLMKSGGFMFKWLYLYWKRWLWRPMPQRTLKSNPQYSCRIHVFLNYSALMDMNHQNILA